MGSLREAEAGNEGRLTRLLQIIVDPNESFDKAIARFKRACGKEGIITEIKKRSYYEKPSDRRRRLELKRQRKLKLKMQKARRGKRR